jgi:hypothetical protein
MQYNFMKRGILDACTRLGQGLPLAQSVEETVLALSWFGLTWEDRD